MVGTSSLQHRFVNPSTAGDDSNHGAVSGGDDLLASGGHLHPGPLGVGIVGDDCGVVTGGPGDLSSVSGLLLEVADDGTLGHVADRHDVANGELGLTSAVDELSGRHAFGSDESHLLDLVPVRVLEVDLRERSPPTGIMDDLFDDALSLELLEDGKTRVGVHIADVSAYVKPGSPLDREAQERGNSTYLVGTVIPMLPHALSNGLCSLVEAEDRLTKTCFITFNDSADITDVEFANTVINSNKRLTYKQAYAFMQQDDLAEIRKTPLPPKHQTGSTGRSLDDVTDRKSVV